MATMDSEIFRKGNCNASLAPNQRQKEEIEVVIQTLAGFDEMTPMQDQRFASVTLAAVSRRLVNALNAVTGNLDEPGGMMWPTPAYDLLQNAERGGVYAGRWRSRVRALPEFDGEFPVATMADEMLLPGPGQVRALITSAGNPVLSTPDGTKLDTALRGLEFMVSIDPAVNETTRHANVILPPATGLEVEHYDVIFHHFAVRNTARYSESLFPIGPEQRYDSQIRRAAPSDDGDGRQITSRTARSGAAERP